MLDPRFVNFSQLWVYFHFVLGSCNDADLKKTMKAFKLIKSALSDVQLLFEQSTSQVCSGETQHQETLVSNHKNRKKLNVTRWKQQSSHNLTLMQRVFYWSFYLFLLIALYQGIINKQLLSRLTEPSTLRGQNPLSVTGTFCRYSTNVFVRHHCQIFLLPRNHQKTKNY